MSSRNSSKCPQHVLNISSKFPQIFSTPVSLPTRSFVCGFSQNVPPPRLFLKNLGISLKKSSNPNPPLKKGCSMCVCVCVKFPQKRSSNFPQLFLTKSSGEFPGFQRTMLCFTIFQATLKFVPCGGRISADIPKCAHPLMKCWRLGCDLGSEAPRWPHRWKREPSAQNS